MAFIARLARKRRVFEAARLATMLAVELQSLADHYTENLAMLDSGTTLLSLRSSGSVYRFNANRMAGLLSERVLAPLVAVHAHHERIEALLQVIDGRPPRRSLLPRQASSGIEPRTDTAPSHVLRIRFEAGRRLITVALEAIAADWPNGAAGDSAGANAVTDAGEIYDAVA